jgi:RNA polymerase sigma-70 factor (ECF subfamily)
VTAAAQPQLPSDAALVERVRHGDRAAFSTLYERHSSMVYSIALAILREPALAEDVAQDAFVALWRQPDRYNPAIGRFAPWFYRVARNRAIDIVRQKRREVFPDQDVLFEVILPDHEPGPADLAELRSEAACAPRWPSYRTSSAG